MTERHEIDRVALIGAGALGAAYGTLIHNAGKVSVCFIAGGDRYEQLTQSGVTVNGSTLSIPVVRPQDATPVDLVIVAVKHYHLDQAIADIASAVGPDTSILSVMNGIDSEERIGAVYGFDKMLYGLTLGIDAVRTGTAVTYQNLGRILFGEKRNDRVTERVQRIGRFFSRAGIAYENPPDMIRSLWFKFMINVGVNQVSALLRATYGELRESAEAREMMEAAMREVIAIAQAEKVDLTEDAIQDWYKVLTTLGASSKTSMLQDVEAGSSTEVEMLAGTMLRLGELHGIPTPVNLKFYRELSMVCGIQPDTRHNR